MQRLTHWGQVTHICVGKLVVIGSDNGLSPGQCQAITWTNGEILIGPLGINFSKISNEIHIFSFKKMQLKMSVKWHPFCLGLNVLTGKASVISKQSFRLLWNNYIHYGNPETKQHMAWNTRQKSLGGASTLLASTHSLVVLHLSWGTIPDSLYFHTFCPVSRIDTKVTRRAHELSL